MTKPSARPKPSQAVPDGASRQAVRPSPPFRGRLVGTASRDGIKVEKHRDGISWPAELSARNSATGTTREDHLPSCPPSPRAVKSTERAPRDTVSRGELSTFHMRATLARISTFQTRDTVSRLALRNPDPRQLRLFSRMRARSAACLPHGLPHVDGLARLRRRAEPSISPSDVITSSLSDFAHLGLSSASQGNTFSGFASRSRMAETTGQAGTLTKRLSAGKGGRMTDPFLDALSRHGFDPEAVLAKLRVVIHRRIPSAMHTPYFCAVITPEVIDVRLHTAVVAELLENDRDEPARRLGSVRPCAGVLYALITSEIDSEIAVLRVAPARDKRGQRA